MASTAKLSGRHFHLERIDEEPEMRAVRKSASVRTGLLAPAPGAVNIGVVQGIGRPGHRAAFAGDMKADGKLSSGRFGGSGSRTKSGRRHRSMPTERGTGRWSAGEGDRRAGPLGGGRDTLLPRRRSDVDAQWLRPERDWLRRILACRPRSSRRTSRQV